jgi:GDPmannose 4,6-dehydratase
MVKKIALITGITGQDGAYLSEFLLNKNYIVHGIKRRSSSINTQRIDKFYKEIQSKNSKFILHHGDMMDTPSIYNIISKVKPQEIYNLAAQSHVAVSFEQPEYTANADALGTLRILEAIRHLNLIKKTKFYQAGTSELFGGINKKASNEKTSFYPRSPYGAAKLYAHWITVNYREAYKIFACNGILFNHESPLRGETFVTQKIIKALTKIKYKKQKKLYIGNLYARRDWGHAKDYVEAMWLMLQQKKPDDYVIATGKQYSIKDFINITARELRLKIFWKKNKNNEEIALNENKEIIIQTDKRYFRPTEVHNLIGDASKARRKLKWSAKIKIKDLVKEMIKEEISKF